LEPLKIVKWTIHYIISFLYSLYYPVFYQAMVEFYLIHTLICSSSFPVLFLFPLIRSTLFGVTFVNRSLVNWTPHFWVVFCLPFNTWYELHDFIIVDQHECFVELCFIDVFDESVLFQILVQIHTYSNEVVHSFDPFFIHHFSLERHFA